jgi:predicted TIM-barrel fold metal-dependent hydrolase
VPVLCHVADPEEFWDVNAAPSWAREQGWTYDDSHPSKRELYDDLGAVLGRHPEMSIVVAHVGFLSADIDAAAAFFGRYAHAALDLAPGIELLWNMSAARDRWREFFIEHQDRILFGTDIAPWQSVTEALARIWVVRTFLESDGEFVTPPEADRLMTRYDRPFRGLGLPDEVLAKVYAGNFQRVFGRTPRPIDARIAARIAHFEAGQPAADLFGAGS